MDREHVETLWDHGRKGGCMATVVMVGGYHTKLCLS